MPRKRSIGLSAGEAVLGLVIEQPDTASRLGKRLVERFRAAQFTSSTAHNALTRLARAEFVRVVVEDSAPAEEPRWEATPRGVEHFRAWLRSCSSAAPALREELQAKVEFCTAEDLPHLIEAIRAEERACASMFAAAQGRLSEADLTAPRHSSDASRWSAATRRAVLRDEAAMWGMRFKRLERLRARVEELREAALPAEPKAVEGPLRGAAVPAEPKAVKKPPRKAAVVGGHKPSPRGRTPRARARASAGGARADDHK
jgi:DNA-binding PadR family transcriptional regulator